ncbi:MAG: MJ0042-type zinc finger domain-containing protein [Planctomycetaceae bacterium]
MPITVSCPECAQTYRLKDELAGKKVRCKGCETIIPIPQASSEIEDYNFDDDLDFDDEQNEREARRRRAVRNQSHTKTATKKKKKKRRSSNDDLEGGDLWFSRATKIALGVGAFDFAFALLFFVTNLDILKGPSAIAMMGSIGLAMIYIIAGGLWNLSIVLEEDVLCLLLWFFVPFYSLYYIISRWDQCARPVLIQFMGFGIILAASMIPVAVGAMR